MGIRDRAPVRRFRRFRQTRPFWAGLFVIAGGIEIGYLPLGPISVLIHAGAGVFAGLACSLLLILMGLVLWFAPSQRTVASLVAAVVSLASFPLSNLGGFVVGMLLGVVGASLGFGWVPDKRAATRRQQTAPDEPEPPRRPRPGPESVTAGAGPA